MKNEVFIDTSGFYALLAIDDDRHAQAKACLAKASVRRTRFLTTDYVLDETATLLKARGKAILLVPFFERVFASKSCRIAWTDAERFNQTRIFFLIPWTCGRTDFQPTNMPLIAPMWNTPPPSNRARSQTVPILPSALKLHKNRVNRHTLRLAAPRPDLSDASIGLFAAL